MKYNKKGIKATSDESVFAECVDGNVQQKYLVLTHNNLIYDPRGTDSHRESVLHKTLRSTNKTTFDYYLQYLQTGNALFMTRAQRSYIND